MLWRLQTAHPKLPGEVWFERVMHSEAGTGRARACTALLSYTKGRVLSAEGRRNPLNL